jgi:hypothetical protein
MLEKMLNAISGRGPVNAGMVLREFAADGIKTRPPRWQRGMVPYVIFQISCDGGKDITAPLAQAVRLIRRPGCVLEANMATMLFVTFPGIADGDGAAMRDEVANALMKNLGRRVRLVKGMIGGVQGDIGRGENCIHGTAFLGLEKLCMALFTQSYGYYNTLDLGTGGGTGASSDSSAAGAESSESKKGEVIDV